MRIYFDMDGVIADFNGQPNALQRYATEKGFFKKLKPIKTNIKTLKKLNKTHQIFIMTKSPNEQANNDKMKWLEKYLPFIPQDHIYMVKPNESKADTVAVSSDTLLIDDYTANLIAWQKKGGKTLKYVGKNDNVIGKHIVYRIPYTTKLKNYIRKELTK